jgi:hypothetical protein
MLNLAVPAAMRSGEHIKPLHTKTNLQQQRLACMTSRIFIWLVSSNSQLGFCLSYLIHIPSILMAIPRPRLTFVSCLHLVLLSRLPFYLSLLPPSPSVESFQRIHLPVPSHHHFPSLALPLKLPLHFAPCLRSL